MLLLRQLTPPLTRFCFSTRLYAKKAALSASFDKNMKQVHQEMLKHVNPCARINIRTDILLKVRSADVHTYPDADAFVAELHGGPERNCTATMRVQVSDDEKQVDVLLTKTAGSTDFHCELEVPIRADLHIESKDAVSVANMHGEEVNITAEKDINTHQIRAKNIRLCSEHGHINCKGLLLGQFSTVETKGQGNVFLDKLQGDQFSCKTSEGNVSTNSCYVEESKFETDSGNMQLKNVHKKTAVFVYKKGDLNMTGVHGNICVRSNGGRLNLQLSEICGENIIMADQIEEATINISDAIEENSFIEITASPILLDSTLSHLSDCISEDKQTFRMSVEQDNHNKLMVCTKGGGLKLGKLSWADSMRVTMGISEK